MLPHCMSLYTNMSLQFVCLFWSTGGGSKNKITLFMNGPILCGLFVSRKCYFDCKIAKPYNIHPLKKIGNKQLDENLSMYVLNVLAISLHACSWSYRQNPLIENIHYNLPLTLTCFYLNSWSGVYMLNFICSRGIPYFFYLKKSTMHTPQ